MTDKGGYDFSSKKIQRIRKWIEDAGLYTVPQPGYGILWHVGKNKGQVATSSKVIRKFDYDNEVRSGVLFGFPIASVEAYAHNRKAHEEGEKILMVNPGSPRYKNSHLKNKYYTPYVLYAVRADLVAKDSSVAKKWADVVRKDVPILAKWFEKREVDRRKRDEKRNLS